MTQEQTMTAFQHTTIFIAQRMAVCLTAFAMIGLTALPAAAAYGPRVTVGNVYQQTSTTESPNGIDAAECFNASHCYFLFQRVPNDLIIEHLSCTIEVTAGTPYQAFLNTRAGRSPSMVRYTILVPAPTAKSGTFTITANILHPLPANHRPFVLINNTANAAYFPTCTISGHIVAP